MESNSQGKSCDAHHQEYAINYKVQISHLEKRLRKLGADIMLLQDNGYMVEELDMYIRDLHNYNELKDIGQMLLGKLACLQETTTKHLYERYGLDLSD